MINRGLEQNARRHFVIGKSTVRKKARVIQKQNIAPHVLSCGGYEFLENKLMEGKKKKQLEEGILMWEEIEEQRLNGISKSDKYKEQLEKMGLDSLLQDISDNEASKQATKMRSQIHLLWGTLLYERSVVEYKLGLPT